MICKTTSQDAPTIYVIAEIKKNIPQYNNKINSYIFPLFEILWYCQYFMHFCSRHDDTEKPSQKKSFVNSKVLSLTTQGNIGSLNPPLKLTFQNVQTVRKNVCDNDMCNFVTLIYFTNNLILHFIISVKFFRNAIIVCFMEF